MSIYTAAQEDALLATSAAIKRAMADVFAEEARLAHDHKPMHLLPDVHSGMVHGLTVHMMGVAEALRRAVK